MDQRKQRNGKFEDGLILDRHRIPHIQTGPSLVNKAVAADNIAYSPRRPALVVKDGVKKYGSNLVLHNLNMFAKEGTIYCLVGASNTGKSTLLQCVTGQRRLTKGELLIFGSSPGSASSGIPGRRVGYMPQELGLHTDLSITEVLQYHGRLNGMTLQQIGERIKKLSELLDLQQITNPLIKLSPGLQKRASLACALIHEPELIVLDQPTHGMDVLFQKGIWMHLQKLVLNGRTSVILSTQNLEEARQAHRVGVLRNGRLLVEDSPATLLTCRHGTQLLSEAVAKLSIKDTIRLKKEGEKKNGKDEVVVCMDEWNSSFGLSGIEETKYSAKAGTISAVSYKDWVEQVNQGGDEDQIKLGLQGKDKCSKHALKMKKDALTRLPPYPNPSRIGNRFRALFIKQLIICRRNPFRSFIFSILIPLLVMLGFCHCIGRTGPLSNISIGIYNGDTEDKNFTWESCNFVAGCTDKMLKCRFLDTVASKDDFKFVDFTSEEDALKGVSKGEISALVKFQSGFDSQMYKQGVRNRSENIGDKSISPPSLDFIYDDGNSILMRQFLSAKLSHALTNLENELDTDCNAVKEPDSDSEEEDESSTVFPVDSQALISTSNGTAHKKELRTPPGYREFYIPSAMMLLALFTPLFISSGFGFLQERRRGLLTRASVSGASIWESLLVHCFVQLPNLIGTTIILILVPMLLFGLNIEMLLIWEVVLLLILTGFLGISTSFMLCTTLDKYHHVTMIGTCLFVTSLILSGLLWPVTSQHWIVVWGSHYLPLTQSTAVLRSIIGREWTLLNLESGVWQGFAVIGAWTGFVWLFLFLVLTIRYLRR